MMRSNLASRIGMTALAVGGALAIMTPAANAEPVATDIACVYTGVAGNLVPGIPYPPAGLEQDGLYSFDGDALCVGADGLDGTVIVVPVAAHIESNGYYSNLQLGTGDVAGVACISSDGIPEMGATDCPQAPGTPAIATMQDYFRFGACCFDNTRVGYGIDFVNGTGTLGGGAYGPEIETGETGPDAYNVIGAVQLVPDQLYPGPVTSFTVAGGFVAESP